MPWITGFAWDDENLEHIAGHGVSADEVEEAITGNPLVIRGREDRYLAYGKTADGRLLLVVRNACIDEDGEARRETTGKDSTVQKRPRGGRILGHS